MAAGWSSSFHINDKNEEKRKEVKRAPLCTARETYDRLWIHWSTKRLLHVYNVKIYVWNLSFRNCAKRVTDGIYFFGICKQHQVKCASEHRQQLALCWTVLESFIERAVNWEFERNGTEERSELKGSVVEEIFFSLFFLQVFLFQ